MKKTFRILHPYALDKNYFKAIDEEMARLNDEEWGVIMDLDTMPLRPEFGFQLQAYINKYPDTGMFTCYASRCHYQRQVRKGTQTDNPNILYHKKFADKTYHDLTLLIKKLDKRVAGHLMMIKKSTWNQIRDDVKKRTQSKKILGVDTQITYALITIGLEILLMRDIYLFHFLRMDKNYGYTRHLQ